MTGDERPVLVAYDGSAESRAAVRSAVTLFPGRRLIVITVWEPGLAMALASISAVALRSSSPQITAETARVERDQAAHAAGAGAELARELGATAESIPVTDETNVTVAIASEADRHDTCAVVVGSRGLGRVKAPLLGSTTQGLLRRTRRPVVVVRAPQ
jgi:nucleotide-binding universal stress UspA family protein